MYRFQSKTPFWERQQIRQFKFLPKLPRRIFLFFSANLKLKSVKNIVENLRIFYPISGEKKENSVT
jgi:hypothetical protein